METLPIEVKTPTIRERLSDFGWGVVGIFMFTFFIAFGWAIVYGVVWISAWLLPFVLVLQAIGTYLLIFMLLPSAVFKGSRYFCGNGIIAVSYIWGIALWMFCVLILYELWGTPGMFIGFFLFGFGTVPLAGIALLFTGEFFAVGKIVLSFILIRATRAFGRWLKIKAVTPEAKELARRLGYDEEEVEVALIEDPKGILETLRREVEFLEN